VAPGLVSLIRLTWVFTVWVATPSVGCYAQCCRSRYVVHQVRAVLFMDACRVWLS
jgi:hypothetical protein